MVFTGPIEAGAIDSVRNPSPMRHMASIGPVKTMSRALNAEAITTLLDELLVGRSGSLRKDLEDFAVRHGIEI